MATQERETVKRVSTKTTLSLGNIKAPVGLYKATVDPKSRSWDKPPDNGNTESKPLSGKGPKSKLPGGEAPSDGAKTARVLTPKGVTKPDGKYVELSEQIEQIGQDSKIETMDIVSFMDRRQIPTERVVASYYVGTQDYDPEESPELFPPARLSALLYRAMKEQDAVAIVRWSKRTGQTVGVMSAHKSGALLVRELAFAENWRDPHQRCLTHNHIEVDDAEVKAAREMIENMAGRRSDLEDIRDRRKQLEEELIVRAEHGELDEWTLPDRAEEVEEEAVELGELVAAAT